MKDDTEQPTSVEARQSDKRSSSRIAYACSSALLHAMKVAVDELNYMIAFQGDMSVNLADAEARSRASHAKVVLQNTKDRIVNRILSDMSREQSEERLTDLGRRVAARNIDDGTDSFIIGVEPDEAAVQQRSGDGQAWLSKYVTVLEDDYQFHRARYRSKGDRYDIGVADGIDVALGWLHGLGSEGQSQSNTDERMDS